MGDNMDLKLQEVAERIREMREIAGFSEGQMAEKTEVSVEEYAMYEADAMKSTPTKPPAVHFSFVLF